MWPWQVYHWVRRSSDDVTMHGDGHYGLLYSYSCGRSAGWSSSDGGSTSWRASGGDHSKKKKQQRISSLWLAVPI